MHKDWVSVLIAALFDGFILAVGVSLCLLLFRAVAKGRK